ESAAISLLDDTGTLLMTATVAGPDGRAGLGAQGRGTVPLSEDALAREAFASGVAVYAADYRTEPDAGEGSTAVVPLMFRSRRIGLLAVEWHRRHRFGAARGGLGAIERELLEA